jgi:hypothetical protein
MKMKKINFRQAWNVLTKFEKILLFILLICYLFSIFSVLSDFHLAIVFNDKLETMSETLVLIAILIIIPVAIKIMIRKKRFFILEIVIIIVLIVQPSNISTFWGLIMELISTIYKSPIIQ